MKKKLAMCAKILYKKLNSRIILGGGTSKSPAFFRKRKDRIVEIENKIVQEITPSLTDMGYEVVRVALVGNEIKTVQIMAERLDRKEMMVEDCTKISRTVSALLDVLDPIAGRWTLEVSSPGIDRPLLKIADYERFLGHEAKIETLSDLNGRKRFKGILKQITKDGDVVVDVEGADVSIAFDNIAKAKLILTDVLLKQHQNQTKQ